MIMEEDCDLEEDQEKICRIFSKKGKQDDFHDWCRISSAFLNGSDIVRIPLCYIHMMTNVCLWFIGHVAREAHHQAFISKRSHINVFDTLKALLSINPVLTQHVLSGETKLPLKTRALLQVIRRPNTALQLFPLPPTAHLNEARSRESPTKNVIVQLECADVFGDKEEELSDEDMIPTKDTTDPPGSLRDAFSTKAIKWPSHFPPLPSPTLTFQGLPLVGQPTQRLTRSGKRKTTLKQFEPSSNDASSQVRHLEDKLHVQLLLPKLCDTNVCPIYQAELL